MPGNGNGNGEKAARKQAIHDDVKRENRTSLQAMLDRVNGVGGTIEEEDIHDYRVDIEELKAEGKVRMIEYGPGTLVEWEFINGI